MKVTLNGKITAVLPKRAGVSKAGKDWATQDYVLLPDGDEDVICFNVFGEDSIANYNLQVGSQVSVTLIVKSREYNGKFYPEIKAIQCYTQSGTSAPAPAPASAPAPQAPVSADKTSSPDDLPF